MKNNEKNTFKNEINGFLLKQKRYKTLYLILALVLFLLVLFFLTYGIYGLDATKFLIQTNNIDRHSLFKLIITFFVISILFILFSAGLCLGYFFHFKKTIWILEQVPKED